MKAVRLFGVDLLTAPLEQGIAGPLILLVRLGKKTKDEDRGIFYSIFGFTVRF